MANGATTSGTASSAPGARATTLRSRATRSPEPVEHGSGITVREALELPALAGVQVLAGRSGLDREVRFVNVMEVPDILPWTRSDELLLTTGYPLRATPQTLAELVAELAHRGLAGMVVKLGRYLDELPDGMLASADELGFPVLLLPDGVGFDDVINQVLTGVLGRQATMLARGQHAHAQLIDLVLHGGGLPEVTAALPQQLTDDDPAGITVLHVDRTGRITVAVGAELRDDAGRLPAELFDADELFRTTRFGHGVHLTQSGRALLVASVAAEGDLGRLLAIRPDKAWRSWDVITLERGATVAALVVTRELAVAAVERKYRGDLLHDVLVGRLSGAEVVTAARGFGWELSGSMVVVVAALQTRAADETGRRRSEQLAASWASWVRRWDPQAAAAAFAAEAVAVLHTPDGTVPGPERIAELLGGLTSRGVAFDGHVGVSRVVETADGLPAAYGQAWEAVRVGRRLSPPGSVSRFDDLGLYRLLSLVPDSAELRSFLADTLGPLAGPEGDVESDELRRTLQVLLDTNLNVAQTARRLHFHYNTLRYRIGKLERMLGEFTSDARLRADLTIALHVWQMRVAHW
jgi:PucR family transcriptional regulator, purine catabolism regulatory protein